VTAQGVIDRYLAAIGGKEKLATVKDMTVHLDARMMNQPIDVTRRYLIPGYFESVMELPDKKLQVLRVLVAGDSVRMQSARGPEPVSEDRRQELLTEARPFAEMDFSDGHYTLKLVGITTIHSRDAYQVDVTATGGGTTSYYFDTQSGLKVREVSQEQGPSGAVQRVTDFGDYRPAGGVLLAHLIQSQMGSQSIRMTVKDVKINTGLTAGDFK
jgi:hypothetical protein